MAGKNSILYTILIWEFGSNYQNKRLKLNLSVYFYSLGINVNLSPATSCRHFGGAAKE
jgi:hypothetical protein